MLKIKSDSIIVKSSAKKCVEYLCDLNNYQFLLPKDKINNWQSSKDFCIFSIQKAYTLDIVKESSNNDQILLSYFLWFCALTSFLGALRFQIAKIVKKIKNLKDD